LTIFDRMLALSSEEAALCEGRDGDMAIPADPIVRIAVSFFSQLLCYTAVVPACDAQPALCLGGCSELPPLPSALGASVSDRGDSGLNAAFTSRWRLWKLQREAVVALLQCTRSPLHPHVAPSAMFTICGALQASLLAASAPPHSQLNIGIGSLRRGG
jgi:hypothetical protein